MTPEQHVKAIAAAERVRADLEEREKRAAQERDDQIRAAKAAGVPVEDIARAAGLSVPRVYQIRAGVRSQRRAGQD